MKTIRSFSIVFYLCLCLANLLNADIGIAADSNYISISEIVLFGLRPVTELQNTQCTPETNKCIRAYLASVPAKSILRNKPVNVTPDNIISVRRRNLEEQIITLLGTSARYEAKLFAKAVPLCIEWEGMSEGPMEEVNLAQQWLEKRPDTPLKPFLHLFLAHRLRAGYEAANREHTKGLHPIIARRYKEYLEKAINSSNKLISCIAKEMDSLPYVYLEGMGRPE